MYFRKLPSPLQSEFVQYGKFLMNSGRSFRIKKPQKSWGQKHRSLSSAEVSLDSCLFLISSDNRGGVTGNLLGIHMQLCASSFWMFVRTTEHEGRPLVFPTCERFQQHRETCNNWIEGSAAGWLFLPQRHTSLLHFSCAHQRLENSSRAAWRPRFWFWFYSCGLAVYVIRVSSEGLTPIVWCVQVVY